MRECLAAAARRAQNVRGTVMLNVEGESRDWCSIHVAVDGAIEVHVAEPRKARRWWRPRGDEQWLNDHGFIHVFDAWTKPAPNGASPQWCAETLSAALVGALGVEEPYELVDTLVHPGVIGDDPAPDADAPHLEHIRFALRSLAANGRGKLSFDGGRPSSAWAWAFVVPEGLEISPQPRPGQQDPSDDWTIPSDPSSVDKASERLTDLLHHDHERDANASLFVSFMNL